MDILIAIVVVLIGFFQALMGSSVSGGGMIAVPALLATGIPPHAALGTIRPAYLASAVASIWRWKAKGYLKAKESISAILPAFVGALIGAVLILQASETLTKYLIGALIFFSIFFLLIKKDAGIIRQKKKNAPIAMAAIALGVGVISGAVGVVGGTVYTVALVLVVGVTMKEALALSKVRALGNQTAALMVFALASSVMWDYAALLMAGSIVGSIAGVEITHKMPIKILKPLFIIIAVLLVVKFLFF